MNNVLQVLVVLSSVLIVFVNWSGILHVHYHVFYIVINASGENVARRENV